MSGQSPVDEPPGKDGVQGPGANQDSPVPTYEPGTNPPGTNPPNPNPNTATTPVPGSIPQSQSIPQGQEPPSDTSG